MEITTKRKAIKRGISQIKAAYSNYHSKEGKIDLLKQLDKETCSAEDVDRIIGNDSWTRLVCNECKCSVEAVAEFDSSYMEQPFPLCLSCLKAAVQKLEGL